MDDRYRELVREARDFHRCFVAFRADYAISHPHVRLPLPSLLLLFGVLIFFSHLFDLIWYFLWVSLSIYSFVVSMNSLIPLSTIFFSSIVILWLKTMSNTRDTYISWLYTFILSSDINRKGWDDRYKKCTGPCEFGTSAKTNLLEMLFSAQLFLINGDTKHNLSQFYNSPLIWNDVH